MLSQVDLKGCHCDPPGTFKVPYPLYHSKTFLYRGFPSYHTIPIRKRFYALAAGIILKTKTVSVIPKRRPSQCVSRHTSSPTSSHRFGGNSRGASHQEQWSSCSSASMSSGWPVALCVCAPFLFLSYESNEISPLTDL